MRLTVPMTIHIEIPHALPVQCAAFGHELAIAQMNGGAEARLLSMQDAVATLLAPELTIAPVPGATLESCLVGVSDPEFDLDDEDEWEGEQSQVMLFEVEISVTLILPDGLGTQLAFLAATLQHGIARPRALTDSLLSEDETITAISALGLVRPELAACRIPGAQVVHPMPDLPSMEEEDDEQ